MAYGHRTEHRIRQRAQVALHAARGRSKARVARHIAGVISASTVRRWLKQDAVKRWQYQSWIFIADPAFRPKAERVLDLYARTRDGVPLGADEYVISADEKTSIQARCRCHPTLAPGRTPPTGVAARWPTWHRPDPGPGPAPSLRRPLQLHSTTVAVEVHHLRPWTICWPGSAGTAPITQAFALRRAGSFINPRRTSSVDR